MGQIKPQPPALLIIAAFSRHPEALQWARERTAGSWGPVALSSERFPFTDTDYYRSSMGPDLHKQFFAFERLIDPAALVDSKLQTNEWELDYARDSGHGDARPLNLDPGYITLAKLVLASTKDHAHRLYLSRGIFAEVTLYYSHDQWHPWERTFPDYRRSDYQAFFTQCREYLHSRLKRSAGSPG